MIPYEPLLSQDIHKNAIFAVDAGKYNRGEKYWTNTEQYEIIMSVTWKSGFTGPGKGLQMKERAEQ